jgi:hypothetical protein
MKKILMLALAAMVLLARPAVAQTDPTALETALHGKLFGLKGYPADPVVKYTWTGGKLLPGPVDLHGIMAFFPDTVRLKSGKITIDGQASTLVKNGPKLAPMGKVPMRLEIDLGGADAATVLPQLQSELFFPGIKAALDGIPVYMADMIPFSADGKFYTSCHCTPILQDGKWVKLAAGDTKMGAPGVVKAATNEGLDQKGIDEKVSGTISLVYLVSDAGRVNEVWVAKPLSADTDAMAAKAGRGSVFSPATYEGKPVGTVMLQTIPVNQTAAPVTPTAAPATPTTPPAN